VKPDGSYLPVTSHGFDLREGIQKWSLSRTALRRVRDSGLAILTTDAKFDSNFDESGSIHKYEIRSIICVPLGERSVKGLIYIDSRGDKRPFKREDLEFVTALSLYASHVLERAEEHIRTSDALRASDERVEMLQAELLRHQIVGCSTRLLTAYDSLKRFAKSGARVLIRGETGTGKELFARAFAANSERRGKTYVPVPIPALAPTLVESELFGHVKGAFTEAGRDKKGRLEIADGGVLFLDEVGDIESSLQSKLLRFLDSGELYRVGDTEQRFVDALVVSATSRPLERLVEEGRFRPDLLARLGQVVTLPPLRERPDDIPPLVEHFVHMYNRSGRKRVFAEDTLEVMRQYRWEFNVRQLQQVVERAICLVDKEVILPEDLPDFIREGSAGAEKSHRSIDYSTVAENEEGKPRPLREIIEEVEKKHIMRTLEFTKGNKRKAIEILGLSPDTFYKRLEDFGLHKRNV
jgi:Nif-specific regulatory protein